MKKKFRIFVRKARRTMRKLFSFLPKGPSKKGSFVLGSLLFAIVFIFCIKTKLPIFFETIGRGSKENVIEDDKIASFIGNGFVGRNGQAGYAWLYDSNTLQFDEVWNILALNEKSNYVSLNKSEQTKWESELLLSFGWDVFPNTISRSDAVKFGSYCGFSEKETKQMLFGDANAKIELPPTLIMSDFICENNVLYACFANSKSNIDVVLFDESDYLNSLCLGSNILRFEIEVSDEEFTPQEINIAKQSKMNQIAKIMIASIYSNSSKNQNEAGNTIDDISNILTDIFGDKYGPTDQIYDITSDMFLDIVLYIDENMEIDYKTEYGIDREMLNSISDIDNYFIIKVSENLKDYKKVKKITVGDLEGNKLNNQTKDGINAYINNL